MTLDMNIVVNIVLVLDYFAKRRGYLLPVRFIELFGRRLMTSHDTQALSSNYYEVIRQFKCE